MTLRLRIVLTVVGVLVGLVITLSVTIWALSLRNLSKLEAQAAHEDVARTLHVLDSSLGAMGTVLKDWGEWDDTYEFALDHNEAYIEENLGTDFAETFDVDVLAIFDVKGTSSLRRRLYVWRRRAGRKLAVFQGRATGRGT